MAMTMKLQTRRARSMSGSQIGVSNSSIDNLDHEQMESESDIDRETTIITRVTKTGVANTWWLRLAAMTMKLQTRRSRSIGGSHVEVTDSGPSVVHMSNFWISSVW